MRVWNARGFDEQVPLERGGKGGECFSGYLLTLREQDIHLAIKCWDYKEPRLHSKYISPLLSHLSPLFLYSSST